MPKKTTTKKTPTKKTPAKKAVTKKTSTKKTAVKKKKSVQKKTTYSPEQIYSMTEKAAYYAALNDNFSQDPGDYWKAAQIEIEKIL
jgi:hypothetical protein